MDAISGFQAQAPVESPSFTPAKFPQRGPSEPQISDLRGRDWVLPTGNGGNLHFSVESEYKSSGGLDSFSGQVQINKGDATANGPQIEMTNSDRKPALAFHSKGTTTHVRLAADGTLSKGDDFLAGHVELKQVGQEGGNRQYTAQFEGKTYQLNVTEKNTKFDVSISSDEGTKGKSDAGDWSMTSVRYTQNYDPGVHISVQDTSNKTVRLTETLADQVIEAEARQIKELLGSESNPSSAENRATALAKFNLLLNSGLQSESGESGTGIQSDTVGSIRNKLNEELLHGLTQFHDPAVLKAMGFDEKATAFLAQNSKVEIDPGWSFNDNYELELSNTQVLERLYDASGGKDAAGFIKWTNTLQEKGKLEQVTNAARTVYDVEDGNLEGDEGNKLEWGESNPDNVGEFKQFLGNNGVSIS